MGSRNDKRKAKAERQRAAAAARKRQPKTSQQKKPQPPAQPGRQGVSMFSIGASLLGLVASVLGVWQFAIARPQIEPISSETTGRYEPAFVISNSLLVQIDEATAAMKTGAMSVGGGRQLLSDPLPSSSPCGQLLAHPSLLAAQQDNFTIQTRRYGKIEVGGNRTFAPGFYAGSRYRVVLGVALSYRPVFGLPLWTNTICREFQAVRDPENRVRVVPYP